MIFLVAEIGVNWDGDFKLAREMMKNAKEAGFNAVKFQAFNKEIIKDHLEVNRLIKCAISTENIDEINNIAKSVGIEWFCTPMYPEAVKLLEPYVKRYKVRVSDGRILLKNESSELFDLILETKKDVIVSVEQNPSTSKYFNRSQIKWLYCVSKYPCDLNDLDFSEINFFDGFSNHCPQIIAPLSAAILGTKIIEIHVTSDKSKKFVDNPVSFDYTDQKKLVKLIRDSEKIKRKQNP